MKTIYLHIGTPKTGTTSIQEYLIANELKLHANGYLVPRSSRINNGSHICLTNYALDVERECRLRLVCNTHTHEDILKFRKKIFGKLRQEIREYPGECVILSDEHCYRRLVNESEFTRLKQLFEGLYNQLKVIIYIREQSDMFCSNYSTSLKNNNKEVIGNLAKFSRTDYLNYNQTIKKWETIFGIENIILRIFDRDKMHKNDVVSDFCHMLNIPRYDHNPVFRNISLNAKQCEFLRIVNIGFGKMQGKKEIRTRHQLNQMVINTQIEGVPISYLINRAYQDVYNESNKALAARYFGKEMELFNKKILNDYSLDQTKLLTEEDKKNLVMQIIDGNHKDHVAICKCIAAIFQVPYQNQIISLDYVSAFRSNDDNKNKLMYFMSQIKRWIVN